MFIVSPCLCAAITQTHYWGKREHATIISTLFILCAVVVLWLMYRTRKPTNKQTQQLFCFFSNSSTLRIVQINTFWWKVCYFLPPYSTDRIKANECFFVFLKSLFFFLFYGKTFGTDSLSKNDFHSFYSFFLTSPTLYALFKWNWNFEWLLSQNGR